MLFISSCPIFLCCATSSLTDSITPLVVDKRASVHIGRLTAEGWVAFGHGEGTVRALLLVHVV